jgi:ABC-type nickel/cobalt efflux system permease component RcnA
MMKLFLLPVTLLLAGSAMAQTDAMEHSHTHTHSHDPAHTHTHPHTHTFTHTHTHTHSHTTHTHTHAHTHIESGVSGFVTAMTPTGKSTGATGGRMTMASHMNMATHTPSS